MLSRSASELLRPLFRFKNSRYRHPGWRVKKFSSITDLMPNLKQVIFFNMEIDTDAFRDSESPESVSTIEVIKFQSPRGDFSKENAIEISKTLPNCKVYWERELVSPTAKMD